MRILETTKKNKKKNIKINQSKTKKNKMKRNRMKEKIRKKSKKVMASKMRWKNKKMRSPNKSNHQLVNLINEKFLKN
jgi:hypothetical protein